MNYLAITILILAALLTAYFKLKDLVFKAKDAAMVKEDQTLKETQDNLDTQITELKKKMDVPANKMSPEEIEVYWNKDTKK